MKALIDRVGYVARNNGRILKKKAGASVTAVRRSGGVHTLDSMDHFFLAMQIVIVGRVLAIGRDKGDVERDAEGMELASSLGRRMAWVLGKLHG